MVGVKTWLTVRIVDCCCLDSGGDRSRRSIHLPYLLLLLLLLLSSSRKWRSIPVRFPFHQAHQAHQGPRKERQFRNNTSCFRSLCPFLFQAILYLYQENECASFPCLCRFLYPFLFQRNSRIRRPSIPFLFQAISYLCPEIECLCQVPCLYLYPYPCQRTCPLEGLPRPEKQKRGGR